MSLSTRADATEALIAGLGGVVSALSGQVVSARNKRIEDRVERALREGAAPPALRDFCLTLANTDENLLEEFCAIIGTPSAYLRKSAITLEQEERAVRQFERRDIVSLNSDASHIADQLGIDVQALS